MGDLNDDSVTVENADGFEDSENSKSSPIKSDNTIDVVLSGFGKYGGFIILGLCLFAYFWPRIRQAFSGYSSRRSNETIDSETAFRRQEAMDAARRKMQEQMNMRAERHKEEQEEKDRLRAKERIEEWEKHKKGLGYHSKVKVQDDESTTSSHVIKTASKKRLRPNDYNPLIGDSSSSSFRPRPNLSQGG